MAAFDFSASLVSILIRLSLDMAIFGFPSSIFLVGESFLVAAGVVFGLATSVAVVLVFVASDGVVGVLGESTEVVGVTVGLMVALVGVVTGLVAIVVTLLSVLLVVMVVAVAAFDVAAFVVEISGVSGVPGVFEVVTVGVVFSSMVISDLSFGTVGVFVSGTFAFASSTIVLVSFGVVGDLGCCSSSRRRSCLSVRAFLRLVM